MPYKEDKALQPFNCLQLTTYLKVLKQAVSSVAGDRIELFIIWMAHGRKRRSTQQERVVKL
ncbi:hypothetical protein O9992_08550 [Vibrio lentus]|nr:hypothetical protein [Vibrio lentus]